ncbi:MAG: hypothetical protein RLZZ628_2416 [Bacteroidota bacterium]|jgi:hypothetical protein
MEATTTIDKNQTTSALLTEQSWDTFWDTFLEKNKHFTETCVYENIIKRADLELLSKETMNVIKELCRFRTNAYGFRIYIEGKEQDYNYLQAFYRNPPLDDEDITQYAQRIFPDKKFGMILNRCEKFSDKMATRISIMTAKLFEKIGMPVTGLDITLFVGNYGWTPLGIHQDQRGENVIHFHLGPGEKTMYNWEETEYRKLSGDKENNKDIIPLLPHAQVYPFKTGDLYYMPWDKYHVGYSDQVHIGVTLWFNNPTRSFFSEKIMQAIKDQFAIFNNDILYPEKGLETAHSLEALLSAFQISEKLSKLTFKEFLHVVHDEFKMALLSNGGWASRPLALQDDINYKVDEYEFLEGQSIKNMYPFKIYYKKEEEELILFARGSKIEIKYHPALEKIIDDINTNKTLHVTDLLVGLTQDWPIEAGLYFLSLLYNKRAIELV